MPKQTVLLVRWQNSLMSLEQRTHERIAKDFSESEQSSVGELLSNYSGPEAARVQWDILELSKGSSDKVRLFVQAAQTDYRDILYWAEYYDSDPMFRGRDPKQIVDDIIAKWGKPDA
jgi:hypothetical protein